MHEVPDLEAVVDIAAPAARVWDLVSDICRMNEWSPQVQSTRLRSGFEQVAVGSQFTNRNTLGELAWTTHAEIVALTPEQELTFRVEENWVVWSFSLAPAAGGTRLTQRRTAPDGVSDLSHELTVGFMGGHDAFTETMRSGMSATLAAIKAAAESTVSSA